MPDAFRHVTKSIAPEGASYMEADCIAAEANNEAATREKPSNSAPIVGPALGRRGIHARCFSPRDEEHRA